MPQTIVYPVGTGITAHFSGDGGARGWNENGQLKHLRYLKTGQANPIRSLEFDYDPSGNRTIHIETTPAGTVYWKYSYDYLDRLEKVEKGTNSSNLLEVSHYAYDESDNRTELILSQDLVKYIYSYDAADSIATREKRNSSTNALLFTETFNSDDDGNLLTRAKTTVGSTDVETITYGWDSFDKLISVSSSLNGTPTNDVKQENSYLANGFRRKKKAKNGNVTTEYATGLATAVAKTGNDAISYIQGHHLLGYELGGSFYYYLTNHLGSVTDIISGANGSVLQSYEYKENGEKTVANPSGPQSAKTWVGGLSVNDDTEDSGLYLMGHRHYSPSIGRFLSRDPIGFAGDLNLFSYASNNGSTYTDPTGLLLESSTYGGHVDGSINGGGDTGAGGSFIQGFGTSVVAALGLGALAATGPVGGGVALTLGISGFGIGVASTTDKVVRGEFTRNDAAFLAGGALGGGMMKSGRFSGQNRSTSNANPDCPTTGQMQGPTFRMSSGHIFRDSPGHMRTPSSGNVRAIQSLAQDPRAVLGVDMHGTEWNARMLGDGSQLWAQIRGNAIRNAGRNITPRGWDPRTGLSGPNRPTQ